MSHSRYSGRAQPHTPTQRSDISLGHETVRSAKVGCVLIAEGSSWGLYSGHRAAILRLEITLVEPNDTTLSSAEALITFSCESTDPVPTIHRVEPEQLYGPAISRQEKLTFNLAPQVQIALCSLGLGSFSFGRDEERTSRWSFRGCRLADDNNNPTKASLMWTANKFNGNVRPPKFISGIALYHSDHTFQTSVRIDARLRGDGFRWFRLKGPRTTIIAHDPENRVDDLKDDIENLKQTMYSLNNYETREDSQVTT